MYRRPVKLIVLPAFALWLVVAPGCARYTLIEARSEQIKPTSMVAISVWAPGEMGYGATALEAYLTAALIQRSVKVRPLRLELILGQGLLPTIMPEGAYSARRAVTLGMSAGGEIEGSPQTVAKVLESNELNDAASRLAALAELARAVPVSLGIDYLLVVHRFDTYGYAAYLVNLREQRIVNAFVISGTRLGFWKALGSPRHGREYGANDGDASRMEILRLVDYIAARL